MLFRRRALGEQSGAERRIGARVRKSRQKEAAGAADAGPNLQPAPLMDMDFAVNCQLVQRRMPPIRFLSIGSRLCSTLLSDSHLTVMPLRFAITSPPSGCEGDSHPQAVKHARHTMEKPQMPCGYIFCSRCVLRLMAHFFAGAMAGLFPTGTMMCA